MWLCLQHECSIASALAGNPLELLTSVSYSPPGLSDTVSAVAPVLSVQPAPEIQLHTIGEDVWCALTGTVAVARICAVISACYQHFTYNPLAILEYKLVSSQFHGDGASIEAQAVHGEGGVVQLRDVGHRASLSPRRLARCAERGS